MSHTSPSLFVLIGASGSGKTTTTKQIQATIAGVEVFSLDTLRLQFYGDNYADAYQQSVNDKHFRSKTTDAFRQLLRSKASIIVDNVSASRKSRQFYINEARNYGYYTVAIICVASIEQVCSRQLTRSDKLVPIGVVKQQYMKIQLPQYGEFDEIVVASGNLIKL